MHWRGKKKNLFNFNGVVYNWTMRPSIFNWSCMHILNISFIYPLNNQYPLRSNQELIFNVVQIWPNSQCGTGGLNKSHWLRNKTHQVTYKILNWMFILSVTSQLWCLSQISQDMSVQVWTNIIIPHISNIKQRNVTQNIIKQHCILLMAMKNTARPIGPKLPLLAYKHASHRRTWNYL